MLRQKAQAIGYKTVPYDALLDEYEPGATTAEITTLFAALRADLVPLVSAIAASGRRPRRDILERDYPVEQQKQFGQAAAAAIGFDFEAGRLDVTTHPFCSGIGPGDCRITTRYNPRHFNESFFGILHEAGHGIYEQGLPAEHFGTPLGTFASLGIHESQSRLWENQVGRGQPFWEHFFPLARQAFPAALDDVGLDDFLFAINDVQPSFIRVEADEATYNMHIILRFELEQALVSGDLKPADVPGAWNEKFHQFFALTPPTHAKGCLQDIHWSMGGIGYFPTYTLGNLYAAQFMEQARHDLADLDGEFRAGRFHGLKGWLNEKIHSAGQRHRCRRFVSACHRPPFEPSAFDDLLTRQVCAAVWLVTRAAGQKDSGAAGRGLNNGGALGMLLAAPSGKPRSHASLPRSQQAGTPGDRSRLRSHRVRPRRGAQQHSALRRARPLRLQGPYPHRRTGGRAGPRREPQPAQFDSPAR